jgi:hypothetical protein
MATVFVEVLGYDEDEGGLRSFKGVMKQCVDALELAVTLPVQACDIMVKVSTAFEKALEDADRVYLKWAIHFIELANG